MVTAEVQNQFMFGVESALGGEGGMYVSTRRVNTSQLRSPFCKDLFDNHFGHPEGGK